MSIDDFVKASVELRLRLLQVSYEHTCTIIWGQGCGSPAFLKVLGDLHCPYAPEGYANCCACAAYHTMPHIPKGKTAAIELVRCDALSSAIGILVPDSLCK